MKVGARGQVTIPGNLRNSLGFVPGTEVEFVLREEGLLLRRLRPDKPSQTRFERWLDRAAGSAMDGVSTAEFMAATRSSD